MELPEKREKVRFKLGETKDRRKGIGGKRASWRNHHQNSKFEKQR